MEWNDIKIGKFNEINLIINEDPEDLELRLIAALNGYSYEEVLQLPLLELHALAENIAFLYTPPKKRMVKTKFDLGGRRYYVSTNPNDFTVAQYVDFTNLEKVWEKDLPLFLSLFFIPEGHKYADGYDMLLVQQDIAKYLGVEEGLAVAGFFSIMCEVYAKVALHYSKKKLRKQIRNTKDRKEKEILKNLLNTLGSR